MAAARVRQALRDDDSDEEPTQQSASLRPSRRRFDSSGDESATVQRRPLISAAGRVKHTGTLRADEQGDLRPTTPPAGPSARSRQADWASAVLQMLQNGALIAGQPIPGPDALQRQASGSMSSKTSRRPASAAPASGYHRTSVGHTSSASTKMVAARTLDNSSSDEDEAASSGMASMSLPAAASGGQFEVKSHGPPAAHPHGARSSRHKISSNNSAGPAIDVPNAPSSRPASSTGRIPLGGINSSGGGFAAAAAAAFEGLQTAAQSAAHRQQQRASRTRRISGNDSVTSELSHPESLASSRQTLGSSRLSATVQRVVARQRLLDSSSGEEEGDTGQRGQQPESDVGQAARLLARFKSLSSTASASASGLAPAGTPPPLGGNLASGRKSPTAAVAMISALSKGKSGSSAAARPPSAVGSVRPRPQPAEAPAVEAGAFTFNSAQGGGSVISDGISPRMRQAAAAAVAEVSAAAASSMRPLPLTAIVPARLASPVRPQTAPQAAPREPHRAGSTANAEDAGGFAAAGGAAAAFQAAASGRPAHVSSTQRIATWLEQQPTLSSVGIADDIVSEYATTVTGTEMDLDHGLTASIRAPGRAAVAVMESIMSCDMEVPAAAAAVGAQGTATRSRAVRLTISSDEEDEGAGSKAVPASATERRESFKKQAGPDVNNQRAGEGAVRPSAGAAKGAQAAPPEPTAARRLEAAACAAVPAVSPRLVKELTSNVSSPSLRAQSPDDAIADGRYTAIPVVDPNPRASATAAATAAGKQQLAAPGASPRHRQHDNVEDESSSPESAVRLAPGVQRSMPSPLAAGGRLTPNELRVMLSVLSRPAWGTGAGGTLHAVANALSPQPSNSADSVQSFSYSEMLQVMRAMSSGGGGAGGSPSSGSCNGCSGREGSMAGRVHKGSRKDGPPAAVAAPRAAKQQLLHDYRHHQPRSARDLPTAHKSVEVRAPHSARSFDTSSGSLLGEHPMAAPQERDWSASASTVSGRGIGHEEQQQRDFADMVRLWNLVTGRQISPEALEALGLQLGTDGTTTPRSARVGPGSVLSGGSGGVAPSSAAVLAASAAAMATSAVITAAGCATNAYLQPFAEANLAAAAAAGQYSYEQQQRSGSPSAAADKARYAPSSMGQSPPRSTKAACAPLLGAKPQRVHSPLKPRPPPPQLSVDATDSVSIQSDLVRLIQLLSAAGQAEIVPPEASEATKGDLGRLVQLLRAGVEAQAQDDGNSSQRLLAPASTAATASPPAKQPLPLASTLTAPAATSSPAVDGLHARGPSSRRSSADTVETGLALGRLYQSLRNLRVRDEGDQTEGGEMRPIAETTSGCAQTDVSELQGPAANPGAGETDSAGAAASNNNQTVAPPRGSDTSVQPVLGASGIVTAAALSPAALSGLAGKDIRITRALRLPNGQLVELDPLLTMACGESALGGGAVDGGSGQWLQDLRALNTAASSTPSWCISPSTTDGGVQTDLKASDLAAVLQPAVSMLPPAPLSLQQPHAEGRRPMSDGAGTSDTSPSLGSDSAGGMGTSVTVAPAIAPGGAFFATNSASVSAPTGHLTVEGAATGFPLRNLPIASEGGIMDAPNQEAVTAGRLGSAGGMLAYLEAADPTTATALLELVQALQLMTLHQRRRRWISDGSSTASGAYLVEPLGPESLGGSSAGATTLRYSFGTSIGPSVSQAGQASLIDLPDAAMAVTEAQALVPSVKAATTGGLEAGTASPAAAYAPLPKRRTHNSGLPPRPVPADSDPTAKHLRRALRAVSGGGTVRPMPTRAREAIRGGVSTSADGAGAGAPNRGTGVLPRSSGAVTEAAKVHIARALELLSQPQVPNGNAPATLVAADAELRAQEELVAALLALLAPDGAAMPPAAVDVDDADASVGEEEAPLADVASLGQPLRMAADVAASRMLAAPAPEPHGVSSEPAAPEALPAAAAPALDSTVSATAAPPVIVDLSPSRPKQAEAAAKPPSPLHARIQEVLQQAERASAGISSLQVGLSPTRPAAAEVLDGVPFEQAVGFIMDGLRDFDGGPSQLARHLHLMYAPSSGGVFYPTALGSLSSRRQTMVALGAVAVLESGTVPDAAGGDGAAAAAASDLGCEESLPLTDAERERVQTLVSEAVAAAEALAIGARREEEWTAERLGLPLEDEIGSHGDKAVHVSQEPPGPAGPEPKSSPSRVLAGASSDSSRGGSPVRQQGRPMSAGSGAASSKPRFASAGSAASNSSSRFLQLPRASPPGSPPALAAAAFAPVMSPRRLIEQVADLGADAMASLLPVVDPIARPSAGSVQRSAPVTSAGLPPLLEGSDGGGATGSPGPTHAAPVAVPQTFGGALDLPEDSALGPAVPHSMPYLPYGHLDEQLLPIQPGTVIIPAQAPRSLRITAELLSGSVHPGQQPTQQPLPQPAASSKASRVPTFATPSAPAVRGALHGPLPATAGGTTSAAALAVFSDPRLVSTYGGTVAATGPAAAVVATGAPALEHSRLEPGDDTSDDGWESDMAGAARICSPESNPSEVVSFAAALLPLPQPHLQLADTTTTASSAIPAAAAMSSPQPPTRPVQVLGGPSRDPATAGVVDPEVPALTAMDRFKSPKPSYASSPATGFRSSIPSVALGVVLTSTETASGASLEVQPQHSSPWSPGCDSDAKGGFSSVRLARDALSGRTSRAAIEGEDSVDALAGPTAQEATGHDGGRGSVVEAEAAEEVRARRALFTAPAREGLEHTLAGEDATVPAAPAAQTEQLLTQAAQLLLQAMQRAAEGQPEQEAAFRVLAPILQGLAATDEPERQLLSFGSVDMLAQQQHGAADNGAAARGPSFTFGEVPGPSTQQAQHPSSPRLPAAAETQPKEMQHLATAADLESFKDDVMAGVRTALMEIVDMIGSTVVERARAAGNGQMAAVPVAAVVAASPGGEEGWAAGAGLDASMAPERSASPCLAAEPGSGPGQQEIRITRAELEAFMFGKAVLSRNAADDLLGVRLRELYAPQLQKVQDVGDELEGGYDAASIDSNDPRALRDRRSGSMSSGAAALMAASGRPVGSFGGRQGPPRLLPGSSGVATPRKAPHSRFDSMDAAEPETGSPTTVPRDSPLRQPLADGADFKSLFRRSIDHLRGHLQPAHVGVPATTGADEPRGQARPAMVPLPRAPRQPAPVAASNGPAACGLEATLNPAGVPPAMAQQVAAVAAVASVPPSVGTATVAPRRRRSSSSSENDDDVELDVHLSGGLLPEPTTALPRSPDPTAPMVQLCPATRPQSQFRPQSQPHSRRGTTESNAEVEAIGGFLAALAEPMRQVVGVLAQSGGVGGSTSTGRPYPRRSVVIEELADEQSQRQLQFERPSRVPGFAATNSGSHIVLQTDDEDGDGVFGRTARGSVGRGATGSMQLSSPRVASEGNLTSLRLRHRAAEQQQSAGQPLLPQQQQHLARTASTTPVPRAVAPQQSAPVSLDDYPLQQPAATIAATASTPGSPLAPLQYPQTQLHQPAALPVGGSMASMPGTAAEDRALSSFTSEGGTAAALPRRRTHSPGPLTRQPARQAEPSAPVSIVASALPLHACRSMDIVGPQPGSSPSLDELESFLRTFRARIGTDETGDGSVAPMAVAAATVPPLAMQHAGAAAIPGGSDAFRRHVPADLVAEPLAEVEDVRRDSSLSESVSINTARRVITGFNVHTIRASGASALAAAAAVEQAFSPRTERELALAAAAAAVATGAAVQSQLSVPAGAEPHTAVRSSTDDAGSGVSGPTNGSSYATPTNPLLREHLEHFQALLEKANDLVDRLMLADEDLTSEGGAADPNATSSPRNATPHSGGQSARRQLTYRLAPQRSGNAAATPLRQAAMPPLSAMAPGTPADADADACVATPPPASSLEPVPSLDPELAALFPATAARLARPHAHVEQSPDAADSLLSSAVTAVPQLAVGADRARSVSSTPANRSPAASITELRIAAGQLVASDAAVPPPTAAAAGGTPLALVAALLAEAHSRMEFRSLDEQRGADRILSAVLDEHFAHVLGTPRGFLTPARAGPAAHGVPMATLVAGAAAADATTPPHSLPALAPVDATPQYRASAPGPANLSDAFSCAYAVAAEAQAADEACVHSAQQPVGPLPPEQAGAEEAGAVASPRPPSAPGAAPPASGDGSILQQRRQSPSAKMQEEMNSFLAQVMQQRSDILRSALDHVHRAGITPPAPPVAAGAAAMPPPAVPLEMLVAASAMDSMRPTDPVLEPFAMSLPPDAAAADSRVGAFLPNSAIPATSGGLPLMPQPLMPYQELDSDSAPTSYNVSVAGSAYHPSPTWSRGPSPRATVVQPLDSAVLQLARRVSSVVGDNAAAGGQAPVSDGVVPPPPCDISPVAASEPTAARAGAYDLSHLIDDDDSTLSGGPSAVFQRHLAEGGGGSGRPSTLKTSSSTLGGSHSHVPSVPQAPHETALRYNPVYDPLDSSSLGGAPSSGPFGASAAVPLGKLSGALSDGGSFAGGMTTLHHETAYTPLALAAGGDASDGGDGGLATTMHARLRSAGGTSTAVLVPNPTYDDPAECDRHSPAAVAAAAAAAAPVGVPAPGPAVDATGAAYPRLQLQFSDTSAASGRTRGGSASSASGPSAGAAFGPVSPVDAIGSTAVSNESKLRVTSGGGSSGAGSGGGAVVVAAAVLAAAAAAGGPRISSGRLSEVLRADGSDSGANSADLSSLLANSLTESQLNLLAIAPELPSSRHQSHPHMELSAGGASSVAKTATAAVVSGGGTMGDVTMSLDFDEISREAAALADTLSAHASLEQQSAAADPLEATAGAPSAIAGLAAVQVVPLAAGKLDSDDGSVKEAPRSPAPSTPKRHMGEVVAAAVKLFESGATTAHAEGAVPAPAAADAPAPAECPTPTASAMRRVSRSSSSGIPRGAPSPSAASDGARLSRQNSLRLDDHGRGGLLASTAVTAGAPPATPEGPTPDIVGSGSISTSMSAGPLADWQSVALSTGGSGAGLPRQVTGGKAPAATALASRGSEESQTAAAEASTVVTREWVPSLTSQEVPPEARLEEEVSGDEPQPEAPLQEQGSAGAEEPSAMSPAAKAKAAGRPGAGSPARSTALRQSDSPVRPAWRSGAASDGILGAGRTPNSPGGNTTATSATPGRQQQARTAAGVAAARTVNSSANARSSSPAQVRSTASGMTASAGSPARTARLAGTAAAANSASSTAAARRATQSPLRTAPASRTVRASAPGGRMAASNGTATTPQQSQAGPAASGDGKSVRTVRRAGG